MPEKPIRKFQQVDPFGRHLTGTVYVTDPKLLPEPRAGTRWQEDVTFDERSELQKTGSIRTVFEEAQREGIAWVK